MSVLTVLFGFSRRVIAELLHKDYKLQQSRVIEYRPRSILFGGSTRIGHIGPIAINSERPSAGILKNQSVFTGYPSGF